MDLWHVGLLAATTGVAPEIAKGPPWWAVEAIKVIGTLAATLAGIVIGAWLVTRREASVRKEQRAADALFLAVTISGKVEEFVSACSSVSSDNGLNRGQRNPEGYLEAQVQAPNLSFFDDQVVWKALPGKLLDDVHSIPRRHETLRELLSSTAEHGDDDDYFAARQRGYTELGIYAADVSARLRTTVGLDAQIDPNGASIPFLRRQRDRFKEIDDHWEERARQSQDELMASAGTPAV